MRCSLRTPAIGAVLLASVACHPPAPASSSVNAPLDSTFGEPKCLAISGYTADAMEPFVTRDGHFLLFNSSNAPGARTDLFVARLEQGGAAARLLGPLHGANSGALDGVPTVSRAGDLYFVSLRSYDATFATIHRARFAAGAASDVALVQGLARRAGMVHFDVEVSADGRMLIYSRGEFRGRPVPEEADLEIATGRGTEFTYSREATARLAAINTPEALEYAAAISADGRELFFTRLHDERTAAIYRAVRADGDTGTFGRPARLAAIHGFAEAPTLSPDEAYLYFHQRDAHRFRICRVRRLR